MDSTIIRLGIAIRVSANATKVGPVSNSCTLPARSSSMKPVLYKAR